MEAKNKSDIEMISKLIPEEIEGVEYYQYVIDNCESKEVKDFAIKALEDEKRHVKSAYQLLGKMITEMS